VNVLWMADGSIGTPIQTVVAGSTVRVLLIDDDEGDARLTRTQLARVKDIHYEFEWASNYSDGLVAIGRQEHDAILVDHRLGALTGVELIREARKAGSLAPLIMLTGLRDRATDLMAMEAGATEFLVKKGTDEVLLDRTIRYSISHVAMVSSLVRLNGQMAALEEIGRILVQDGPTPESMGRVVDLIVERFGQAQVAIYLADGETLFLAGQRGFEHLIPSVKRSDASVERVVRAGQPVFIRSLTPDADGSNASSMVAGELSVPMMVAGELMGLLNVASPVAAPIGEFDYAAIRLVADRLTAALAVTRERRIAEDRLSAAREQYVGRGGSSADASVIDSETSAFSASLLKPMLEVGISSAGPRPDRELGVLLVECDRAVPGAVARLAGHANAVCANRQCFRLTETQLAVLYLATDAASAQAEATDLVAVARGSGLAVWCGYAAMTPDGSANELITAAQAALAAAERVGPGAVIGHPVGT